MTLLPLQVDKVKMKQGSRVSLDMTTLMCQLPREVHSLVYNMSIEDPGDVGYSSVGGLLEQIRELREVGRLSSIVVLFPSDASPGTLTTHTSISPYTLTCTRTHTMHQTLHALQNVRV